MPDGINRRNFMTRAGAAAAAAGLAGCTGGDGGDGGGDGGDGGDGGSGGGGLDSGSRPVQWMGPAWAVAPGQATMFSDNTGVEMSITRNDIATTQQRMLSGARETFDAFSIDTSGSGALTQDNQAFEPVPTSELDGWNEDVISDLFTNPDERLSQLGAQTQTLTDQLWMSDSKEELRFAPHVYNFDAVGFNPSFVDSMQSEWSSLFDDQFSGRVAMGAVSAITIPEAFMHLLDNDMISGEIGQLNNPTQDQLDSVIDFLVEQKQSGQFRSTWVTFGNSVNLMASEEAVIGDIWQPAALATRREGTPCTYATMSEGVQGYRFWYGGIMPTAPGASSRNNIDEVFELINLHYGSWFPAFIQRNGYSVPHYPNTSLLRDGEGAYGAPNDDSDVPFAGQDFMGPEYYDWSYEGTATYTPISETEFQSQALFDPQAYDWSLEEGEAASDGAVRDSGPIDERVDRIGFFQIWPDNADYMLDRWQDFTSA